MLRENVISVHSVIRGRGSSVVREIRGKEYHKNMKIFNIKSITVYINMNSLSCHPSDQLFVIMISWLPRGQSGGQSRLVEPEFYQLD